MTEEYDDRPIEEIDDLAELEALYEALRLDITEIDGQLASRVSERVSRDFNVRNAYWDWRKKAVAAKQFKIIDLMTAKSRIKVLNIQKNGAGVERRRAVAPDLVDGGAAEVIEGLRKSIHRILDEHGVEPDDFVKVNLSAAGRFLRGKALV